MSTKRIRVGTSARIITALEEIDLDSPFMSAQATPRDGVRTAKSPSSSAECGKPVDVKTALLAFYSTHDPGKVSTVEYFVTWIDANGVESFNDLLFIKYGHCLSPACSHHRLGGSATSNGVISIGDWSTPLFQSLAGLDVRWYILLVTVVVLLVFVYLFGYLAAANLVLIAAGCAVTCAHLVWPSKRRALSSVLHVFWTLLSFSYMLESFFPARLSRRLEYSFLKVVLFSYLFLPNRIFREEGDGIGGTSANVRVKLVTVTRDLVFFCVETCFLLYFTSSEGLLKWREAMFLILLGVLYIIGTRSLKTRDRIVEEIFMTENQYAFHLRTFKLAYVPVLSQVVTSEEMEMLTRHIESITTLAELFSNELQVAMAKDLVGPAFEKFVPFFKMYGPFCAHYDAKRELLIRMRERKEVVDALDTLMATRNDNEKLQSIESYLIMPVQRIPRYVLLLTELIKKTPRWHPDYEACVIVLAKAGDVARFVDDAIAHHASSASSIPHPLLSPSQRSSSRMAISRTGSSSSSIRT